MDNGSNYWAAIESMVRPIGYKSFYSRSSLPRGKRILRAGGLKRLFSTWDRLLSQWATPWLARYEYPDHATWYGERSNIGWLTLAAYESGWVPLQEPSISRKVRAVSRGRIKYRKSSGRSDLWLFKKRRGRGVMYDFEAKSADLSLSTFDGDGTNGLSDIKNKLRKAVRDTNNKHRDYRADVGIGLVFVRLYTAKTSSFKDRIRSIRIFKRSITTGKAFKSFGADFIALNLVEQRITSRIASLYEEEPHIGIAIIGRIS